MYIRSSLIVQVMLDFVRNSTIELTELIKKMYDSIIVSFILNKDETEITRAIVNGQFQV